MAYPAPPMPNRGTTMDRYTQFELFVKVAELAPARDDGRQRRKRWTGAHCAISTFLHCSCSSPFASKELSREQRRGRQSPHRP
jgi:hypothetical protein